MAQLPMPTEGIVLTHFVVTSDVERSRRFYADVLGGEVVLTGEPSVVALANGWIVINLGGPPTDDKPTVTLEPPTDHDRASAFLNIRVADIDEVYERWRARGAEFLTPPTDRGRELRCYMRDPDGHLIEVGQAARVPTEGLPNCEAHGQLRAGRAVKFGRVRRGTESVEAAASGATMDRTCVRKRGLPVAWVFMAGHRH
jgi:catechol 2,3-dioxygenase-like lactoylglutathione lyase family enzyme